MNDTLRAAVWQEMVLADFNARYWDSATRFYQGLDTWFKIGLAVVTSGAIAGWYIVKSHPTVWFYITSAASLTTNLVIPRLKWPALITKLQSEKRAWEKIHGESEKLWRDVEMGVPEEDVKKRLDKLTDRCHAQAGKTTLPKIKFLKDRAERASFAAHRSNDQAPGDMQIVEIDTEA